MFTGVTREICEQAWSVVEAAVARAAQTGVINHYGGTLVVLDPVAADGSILFSAHAGEVDERTLEYATAKARLALRTGRDTSELRDSAPHLYGRDDIKWPGGVIRHGLVVAYSGVQGEMDDMIAEWFASTVRGLCRLAFRGPDGGDAQPTPYLGRSGN